MLKIIQHDKGKINIYFYHIFFFLYKFMMPFDKQRGPRSDCSCREQVDLDVHCLPHSYISQIMLAKICSRQLKLQQMTF